MDLIQMLSTPAGGGFTFGAVIGVAYVIAAVATKSLVLDRALNRPAMQQKRADRREAREQARQLGTDRVLKGQPGAGRWTSRSRSDADVGL